MNLARSITRKRKMESRAKIADKLIAQGKSVAQAALEAGVSQYWLQLRYDRQKIGVLK